MMRVLLLAMTLLIPVPVHAEPLVVAISQSSIEISSSFEGQTLTFFGSIADRPPEQPEPGTYDAVIVITGQMEAQTLRKKASFLGIWGNASGEEFVGVPSFFQVLSSKPLDQIADGELLTQLHLDALAYIDAESGDAQRLRFGRELIRLRTADGLFGTEDHGVQFLSDTVFTARLHIPSNSRPGPYVAQTYVFSEGEVVIRKTDGFSVRKIGFERYLAESARNSPLMYGLVCVALALGSGIIAGFIFKK